MAQDRRRKQVARRIRERVAEIFLHEIKDPRATFVTITDVEINADLTLATIRYTVLGTDGDRSKVAAMLKHAHGYLRTEVAKAIQLRSAPQIEFEYDAGIEHADRIERLLGELLPESERASPAAPGDDEPAAG
ncbi:MAG TPA: 30S ribosome-binding factor RbfA [Planctomycetota bacterium]